MTTPLVRQALLAVLLVCAGATRASAVAITAGASHGPTGTGFSGLPTGSKIEFANALNAVSLQALGLGSALAPSLTPQFTARAKSPQEAAAPAAAAATVDQVVSFLATSPAETETEFRARRAALGALWADDPRYVATLVAELRAANTVETRKAAETLTRLTERYRPAVDAARGRLMMEIPSLVRLEEMGSFEDVAALFDNSLRRKGSVSDGEGAVSAQEHPGQLELFSPDAMAHMAGAHLAKAVPGQRQGVEAVGEVGALPAEALSAANDGPKGSNGSMKTMMGAAKGAVRDNKRFIGGYIGILGVAVPSIGSILMMGGTGGTLKATAAAALSHAALGPVGLLLLQAFVILALGKLLGWALSKVGQPAVVGQVLGGLMLGPSLLGWLSPDAMTMLFPAASLGFLDPLSQFGLIFFMFIVGLELDTKLLRKQGGEAAMTSHAGIALSFVLGTALALVLFTGFAPAGIPFHVFALFMGISLSITAFPVLASMLKDKKLTKTPTGQLVLTAAAVDDATAWPLLALVVAIASSGSGMAALPMLGMTLAFGAVMIFAVRPLLARYTSRMTREQSNEPGSAVLPILITIVAAFTTHVIGIHALFGAFLAGAIIPRESPLRHNMEKWLGTFSSLILLPIFFALTGLRTQLGLLGGWESIALTALITLVAIAGKVGGAGLVQRVLYKKSWRESLTVGAFMSTKGLMELIVLNIGYDLGILSPTLFAMLVVMAVSTTFLANPLVALIKRLTKEPAQAAVPQTA